MRTIFLLGLIATAPLIAQNPPVPLAQSALATQVTVPNAASTGTTLNTLTKLTGAPSTAVIAATTDTNGILGITIGGAGTAGNATVQTAGFVSCIFDGATTSGDYVQISSMTAGYCTDGGSTLPASGQVLGRVLSTHGGAGAYQIDLTGGGGSSSAQHITINVTCENLAAGSRFSIPASGGATLPACDSAWSNMDGYIGFASGSTTYALLGPIYLDSSFADPVKAVLGWNSTATTGTYIPSLAALCVSSAGAITTNWWTTATYSNFASSTAAGVASELTITSTLSFTSGCAAGNALYLALRWASGSGTLSGTVQVKFLDLAATW